MAGLFQVTERMPQLEYLSFLSPQPVSRCRISIPQSPPPATTRQCEQGRVPSHAGMDWWAGGGWHSWGQLQLPWISRESWRLVMIYDSWSFWRMRNVSTPWPHASVRPFRYSGFYFPVTFCFMLLGTRLAWDMWMIGFTFPCLVSNLLSTSSKYILWLYL